MFTEPKRISPKIKSSSCFFIGQTSVFNQLRAKLEDSMSFYYGSEDTHFISNIAPSEYKDIIIDAICCARRKILPTVNRGLYFALDQTNEKLFHNLLTLACCGSFLGR